MVRPLLDAVMLVKYVDEEFAVYWRRQTFLYMLVTSVGEKLSVYS